MAWRLTLLAIAMIWACGGMALAAASKPAKKEQSVACKQLSDDEGKPGAKAAKKSAKKSDDDDEGDDDDDDEGIKFNLAGACAKLTGEASYTYQQAKQTGTAGIPVFVNRNGTISTGSSSNTLSVSAGLETTRQTNLGELKTSLSADWSKATGDGTQYGSARVSGWSVGLDTKKLGSLTVGYTGTLMSFWESNMLSTATAPGRSANTIVYEYEFPDDNKVALGLESNLPSTPQSVTGLQNFNFDDPVYTVRWLREKDEGTLHLSALARRADFSASPLLPLFRDTATVQLGWAASAGLKLPAKFIAEDDEFSAQATYAVNAASYLGISTDLTVYQNTVRVTGPTTGWSGVGSVHHEWSEQFESNVFASYLQFHAELLFARPAAQNWRTGINLYWKPKDKLKFGLEFGTVDMKLEPNGILGFFNGATGRAYIGYFSMSAQL